MAGETCYVNKGVTDLSLVTQADGGTVAVGDFLVFGEGNQTVSSSLTQFQGLTGGAGADGFDQVWVKRAFTGNIGSEGGSVKFDIAYGTDSFFVYDAGGGSLYYEPANTANTCDRFKNCGQGRSFFTGGTVTNYEGNTGAYGRFNASAICTNARVFGGTLDALYNATGFTLLEVYGATANIQRPITTLECGGGTTLNIYREDSVSTKPAATTVNVRGGGLKWRGGNITTLNLRGGPIDLSGVTADITIGTVTGPPQWIKASQWNIKSVDSSNTAGGKVTVTNRPIVYGGQVDSLILI